MKKTVLLITAIVALGLADCGEIDNDQALAADIILEPCTGPDCLNGGTAYYFDCDRLEIDCLEDGRELITCDGAALVWDRGELSTCGRAVD